MIVATLDVSVCDSVLSLVTEQVGRDDNFPMVHTLETSASIRFLPYMQKILMHFYFAEHKLFNDQVQYIVSLSHCFFLRIIISRSASIQQNL